MVRDLNEEYQELCCDEMEAERRALDLTNAIRKKFGVDDGGKAYGLPTQAELDAEAEAWRRVAERRRQRREWAAKHI